MSEVSKKGEISIGEFVEGLLKAFKRLRRKNVETLSILIDSIRGMNQEEMIRLERELSILDAYIILHDSSLLIKDEAKSRKVTQSFYKGLFEDVLSGPDWISHFQEGTKIRYKSYFDDLALSAASENHLENLYNQVADNIFGEQDKGSTKRWGLGVYAGAHSEYIKSFISDVLRKFDLAEE